MSLSQSRGGKRADCLSCCKNIDEDIRKHSSSGGIFISIAKKVIQEGGIVFGARFDDRWQVMHDLLRLTKTLLRFGAPSTFRVRLERPSNKQKHS